MSMRPSLCIILGLTWASHLAAQQPSVTGPIQAYTFDAPTRSVRAVAGFSGAAFFGPVLRDNLDFASMAPRQDYGLAFQEGQCLLLSGFGSAHITSRLLAGIAGQPEGVVWSGDGSLAILYSHTGNWFQTVSGFPSAPVVASRVDASSLGGSLASVAASAQGKMIVAGISGQDGGVFESSGDQTFTRIGSLANPIALSFSSDGLTLYVLDGSTPQVLALGLGGEGIQTIPLQGLSDPVAIQAVEDSQSRELLYIAAATDRMIRVVDTATGQIVNDIPVSFKPTTLNQFGSSSYVAAERSQAASPLWLFATTPQPAAYFVPAIQLNPMKHRAANLGSTNLGSAR